MDARYQWQFKGANLLDATNSALVLPNVQTTDAGLYSVTVTVVTNAPVPPATFTATLTVFERVLLTQPQLLPNGDFRALLQRGTMNTAYVIESSTNLIDWSTLATLTYTDHPIAFTNSTTGAAGQRFYRARTASP